MTDTLSNLIDKERTYIEQLESSTITREERETIDSQLDVVREELESRGFNTMEPVYQLLERSLQSNLKGFNKIFTGKGFTNAQYLASVLMQQSSPITGLLLYHGVGVGKTCAAISAASSHVKPKQIIVLTPSSTLITNWKQEIIGRNHCGRNIWNIESHVWKEMSEFKKNALMNQHFSFQGYLGFANKIHELANKLMESQPDITEEWALISATRMTCNDRIIIMDEIHSTRQVEGSTSTKKKEPDADIKDGDSIKSKDDVKKIRPILEYISKYAKSTKLVLLSATPMFNEAIEIDWIINLLRWNHGLSSMNHSQWFNKRENTWASPISKSKQLFIQKIRGFVSYIRGENPYTFPRRLYPNKSQYDLYENNGLTMVKTPISSEFETIINEIISKGDSFATSSIQNTVSVQQKLQEIGDDWTPEAATIWSPKLWTAYNALTKSKGPVFVFSQYLKHGIYEMARVLERMGWKSTNTKRVFLSDEESKRRSKDPFCWANKCRRSQIPKSSTKPFTQAKFCLVDGSTSSANLYRSLEIMNDAKNADGSKCAVIIGSKVIEVGVSMKRIRQVHILDPWFHLLSMEQVIGRAIRNKSHIDLPAKQRNVQIFLHMVSSENSSFSNIDKKLYDLGVSKLTMISSITRLLAENAIDCSLQSSINNIRDQTMINIEDSMGNTLQVSKGDTDFSARCGYSECEIKCASEGEIKDTSKFHLQNDVLDEDDVFKPNVKILMERLPNYIIGLKFITVDLIKQSMNIKETLARTILDEFVRQKISYPNISSIRTYLVKIGDDSYMSSIYPSSSASIALIGNSNIIQNVESRNLPIISNPPPIIKRIKPIESTRSVSSDDYNTLLKQLDIITQANLNPIYTRKNLETIVKNATDVPTIDKMIKAHQKLLSSQKIFDRFEAYPQTKRVIGSKQIDRMDMNDCIIHSFVERLNDTQKALFLQKTVEYIGILNEDTSMNRLIIIISILKSISEVGKSTIPYIMNWEKQVKPYVTKKLADSIKSKEDNIFSQKERPIVKDFLDLIEHTSLNTIAYTTKSNLHIQVLQADNSWYKLTDSEVLEWALSIKRNYLLKQDKFQSSDKPLPFWIDANIDSSNNRLYLKIPTLDPTKLAEVDTKSRSMIRGGVCGQTTNARDIVDIVDLIGKLTTVEYRASTRRIPAKSTNSDGKSVTIQLPSGIYYPKAGTDSIIKSRYYGGVFKTPQSISSNNISICQELEYILRTINVLKDHPYHELIRFSNAIESYIMKI